MGLSLGSVGRFLGNVAPIATNALAAKNEGDFNRALLLKQQQREQEKEDLAKALNAAQVGHLNAQASALNDGTVGNPVPITDANGLPGLAQFNKRTGAGRAATIAAPPSTPASAVPSTPDADPNGLPVPTPQTPQQPAQQPAQGTSQGASGGTLRPYVKPSTAAAKIDPLSPAGVDAAAKKAGAVAAAKAPYVKAAAPPHIDPRSVEGISADSTRAAKVAQATAPYKKDPNAGAGTGAMSGQTMQTMARMGTSYNDLKQAIDQMDQYENTPGNLAKQTATQQAIGAMSEVHPSSDAHGLMGALNNGVGAFVGAKAGQKIAEDPAYRTYLNNKQRVATAFTELLPRPNQQLLQLEKGLSGADVSWNPQLIKNIQGRRRGGLDVLKNILGSQGMLDEQGNMSGVKHTPGKNDPGGNINLGAPSAPAAAPAAASHAQQLWDAAVKLHGQEKVLQEYGPRPGGDE